jgi:peptide-methionine (S)-S-oxide reductase
MKSALLLLIALVVAACSGSAPASTPKVEPAKPAAETKPGDTTPMKTETATFATGCFWCTEAIVQRLPGVISVRSGYIGGAVDNPSYEQVCSGETGHAEALEIVFDPAKISYETLLDWFWRMHDPTTLNQQGADVGTQYRSGVFWHSEAQRDAAEKSKKAAQASFKDPIVTEITKAGRFWPAEDYHQGYFNAHPTQGYCRAIIAPKLEKLGLGKK